MKYLLVVVVSFFLVLPLLCQAAEKPSSKIELVNKPCAMEGTIRVSVSEAGDMSVNNKTSDIKLLEALMSEQKSQLEEICFNRGNPAEAKPHPKAMEVVKLLITSGLPIVLYWDKMFTQQIHFKE